jgi:hypothetical protein
MQFLVWVTSGAFFIAFYLNGYRAPLESHVLSAVSHPWRITVYVLAYIGSPFRTKIGGYPLTACLGFFGLVGIGFCIYFFFRRSLNLVRGFFPWLLVSVYVLLNAMITGIGRLALGLDQANSSRYKSIAFLFWISLIVSTSVIIIQKRKRWASPAWRYLAVSLGTLWVAAYIGFYIRGYQEIAERSEGLSKTLPYLYEYRTSPDHSLQTLHPNADLVRRGAAELESCQLGPFSRTFRTHHERRLMKLE